MSANALPVYALVDTAAQTPVPVVVPISNPHNRPAPAGLTPPQSDYQNQNPAEPHGRLSAPLQHQTQLKQFDYKTESRGRAVAVLTLSAAAAYSRDLATFLGREPITGTVQLHLDKPTVVKSITISISGRCKPKDRTGADNLFDNDTTFLDISHTVWAAHDPKDKRGILGPPGAPPSVSNNSLNAHGSNSSSARYANIAAPDGKLQGDYHWTFAIDLPSAVVAPSDTGSVSFAALQKLRDGYYASAVYSVSVRIQREWTAPDYKIKASVAYIPVVWPPPLPVPGPIPSAGKQSSYGPIERWHALAPVRVMGTRTRTRTNVEIGCTLFLAKPLNYNRGSLIPLCMRLASADPAALDALCAPNAIVVRLQRRGALASVSAANKKSGVVGLRLPVALGGDDGQSLEEGPAAWTAVRHEQNGGEHVRYLAGELGVPRGVKPSSTKIEYSVVLYQFSVADISFVGGGQDMTLREQLVDIDETIC